MKAPNDRAMIRKNLLKFKESVQKFAGLLSSKNVKVTFRGSECCTDGNNIILPAVDLLESSDASDEEIDNFITALVGLVDHEVGHVLFTDHELWKKSCRRMLPQVRMLTNAVEDAFVERKMRSVWKGSGWSIEHKTKYLVGEHSKDYRTMPSFSQIGQLVCLLAKGETFQYVKKFFDADIVRWVDAHLDDEIRAAGRIRCTKDSICLAKRIYKKVVEAFKEPETGKGKDSDDARQGHSEDSETESESSDGTNTDAGGDVADDSRSSVVHDADDKGASGADEGTEPGHGVSSGRSDDLPEESGASSGGSSEDGGNGAGGGEDEGSLYEKNDGSAESSDYEAHSEQDDIKDVFKKFYDRTPSVNSGKSTYTPYTIEGDYVGEMKRDTTSDWYWLDFYRHEIPQYVRRALAYRYGCDVRDACDNFLGPKDCAERLLKSEALASELAGPLKTSLARVLKARGTAYTVRDLDRGHLDRRRLHRIPAYAAIEAKPRVYREDVVAETYNIVVLLCINQSGSMTTFISDDNRCTTTRMDIAIASGLALGDVLHGLNIPFGILGHSTGSYEIGAARYASATQTDRDKFARFGDLKIEWVKGFKDLWSQHRLMMGGLHYQCNTYDAEVVRYGARALCAVQGVQRRIMIMLDDGEPHPNLPEHVERHCIELTAAVREVIEAGVEVVGIGMATQAIEKYYPDNVVVMDLKELPVVLLDKFGKMLGVNRTKRAV